MRKIGNLLFSLLFFSSLACANGANDGADTTATSALTASPPGLEYRHTRARSRFHLGTNVTDLSEGGFQKSVGSDGVFATDEANGWVLAIPNAGSPAESGPLTTDSDEHNSRTLQYFADGGLPASEAGTVQANAMMAGGMFATGQRVADKLVGFTSVVHRTIAGIEVADSFAWARFNRSGEVVAESVYWPAIPSGVVQSAATLQSAIADPIKRRALVDAVVANNPDVGAAQSGAVVIHHSHATVHAPPVMVATYDIIVGAAGTKPRVRHFDGSGREILLVHESLPVQGSGPRPRQ
jgi:hypothetical protein